MKKNKRSLANRRAALYDPYLDTLGGGERQILSILKALQEKGAEISIFWNKNLSFEIESRFSLKLKIKWLPVKNISSSFRAWQMLRSFDYFFYITDGSYFASTAKKNYVYAMVPDKNLYRLDVVNRIKLHNYRFITHSNFTQQWLKSFGIKSLVVPPFIDDKLLKAKINFKKKEKIILAVGRFFSHLHSKRQDVAIKTFKELRQQSPDFAGYKLVLAGGLIKEDMAYFKKLKKLAGNDKSIVFKPNISLAELYKHYRLSGYYWHFAGYGVDEKKNPESVEHLGITPLEAMASGCLTFCFAAGGPKETIIDGKTGFLFNDEKKLLEKMQFIEKNQDLKRKIITTGAKHVKENYNYQVFRNKILKTVF